jgi:hypothetical protein
MPVVEEMQKE